MSKIHKNKKERGLCKGPAKGLHSALSLEHLPMYCAQETTIPALMQAGSGTPSTHTRGLTPSTLPTPVIQTTNLMLPLKRTSAPPPGLHPPQSAIFAHWDHCGNFRPKYTSVWAPPSHFAHRLSVILPQLRTAYLHAPLPPLEPLESNQCLSISQPHCLPSACQTPRLSAVQYAEQPLVLPSPSSLFQLSFDGHVQEPLQNPYGMSASLL